MSEETLRYYSTQSIYSDPGTFKQLLQFIPYNFPELAEILRGIIHPFDALEEVPIDRITEMNAKYIEDILTRIIELSPEPLTVVRVEENRFLGCSRDQSLLMCSVLRHSGFPARLRSGFASYINIGSPGFMVEHVLVET